MRVILGCVTSLGGRYGSFGCLVPDFVREIWVETRGEGRFRYLVGNIMCS